MGHFFLLLTNSGLVFYKLLYLALDSPQIVFPSILNQLEKRERERERDAVEISIFILTVLRSSFLLEAVTLNQHTIQANKDHVSRKTYSYPENSGHHTLLFILSERKKITFPIINIYLASYFRICPSTSDTRWGWEKMTSRRACTCDQNRSAKGERAQLNDICTRINHTGGGQCKNTELIQV